MLRCLYLTLLLCLTVSAARAQPAAPFSAPPAPVTGQTRCSDLVNTTPYTVYGSVQTDSAITAQGKQAAHKANFSIRAGDRWQICSSGPFFDGGRVELIIRTFFPVFSCKTQLGQPIAISATRNAADNGYDWKADCR